MRRTIIALGVFCATSVLGLAGNFDLTCTNPTIIMNGNTPTLQASCRDRNDNWIPTSIPLLGIHNYDGRLAMDLAPIPSSFQRSCGNMRIIDNQLVTVCHRKDGTFLETAIELPITNNNGHLQYAY